MKKIISLILSFLFVLNISCMAAGIEKSVETITLCEFLDGVKKEDAKRVQIYTGAKNYDVDIDRFFAIADNCMMTVSPEPQTIPNGGLYIGVITEDVGLNAYISKDGGVDRAVPAAGRPLKALYTLNNVSYVDRLMALIPDEDDSPKGEVPKNIYSTDIKACINGVWVDSYNIGGRTVVVVEDITNQYIYSDAIRTLVIDDLAPAQLVSGSNRGDMKPGIPVGKIYETDIKTYFRGKELTCYSLNGKMAIEIEELGEDNEFSDIGGKYIWNADERTLSLKCLYRYPYSMRNMLEDSHLNIKLIEAGGVLEAEFVPAPLEGGYILCEMDIPDNTAVPVLYNDEIIGYRCKFPVMRFEDSGYSLINVQDYLEHYDVDKIEAIVSDTEPVQITAEDWLRYFEMHTLSTVVDSFETDEYMFLHMWFTGPHGGTAGLIKLSKKDGTRIDYDDNFESVSLYGQKRFENVVIDKENEKVYLHYDVDYVIDLKTDTVLPVEN